MSYSDPAASPTPEGAELFSLDPEANRHPQEMYRALRAAAPVLSLDGMGHVLTTKEAAMEAFRQPEVFSSAATVDTLAMGAVRPLIPLQIDPPDHKKYRKILDPIFAPRRWPRSRTPVTALGQRPHRRVRRPGRGRLRRASSRCRSRRRCSSRCSGLPLDELDRVPRR